MRVAERRQRRCVSGRFSRAAGAKFYLSGQPQANKARLPRPRVPALVISASAVRVASVRVQLSCLLVRACSCLLEKGRVLWPSLAYTLWIETFLSFVRVCPRFLCVAGVQTRGASKCASAEYLVVVARVRLGARRHGQARSKRRRAADVRHRARCMCQF